MTEQGTVTISVHHDPVTGRHRTHIDRADPRARISVHLIQEIHDHPHTWATIDAPDGAPYGLLTLADDYGQRFIYRIDWTDYRHDDASFRMEWPD